ncbi:MAG: proton-conducting transporter membrane subunit [Bacillota bacterium]
MWGGAGILTGKAVGGFAMYILSHGMIKGALFMGSGILLHRLGSVDEMELKGRGRRLWRAGVVFVVAGLGLAGLPPFGTYVGKSLIEESAKHAGYGWIPWLFLVGSALTAGAVLRVAGRVFLGWGPSESAESGSPTEQEEPETECGGGDTTPGVMVGTAAVLVVIAQLAGVFPQLVGQAERAGERFMDWRGYAERVMEEKAMAAHSARAEYPAGKSVAFALGSVVGSMGLAAMALMGERLAGSARKIIEAMARPIVGGLNAVHSGHVGDYVVWLVVGMAVFGGCLAVLVG